jgi:TatD DNase family protein
MRLVDPHAHLQAEAFERDADEVLARAREAGVERLLVPGWDLPSSRAAIDFGRRHGLPAAAGIHPHVAAGVDAETWAAIEALAGEPDVVGIGETGLDHDRAFSPLDIQRANLERHIELAFRVGKPLILHCRSAPGERDAQDVLLDALRSAGVGGPQWRARFGDRPPGVLHSFSGPVDYAEEALAMDLAISFSGLVFRRREEASAEVARLVPADRLLVETDSPYLKPRGVRGSRNEPRWVAVTAGWLAEQRGEDPEALGEGLVAAYDRFAGLTSARPESRPPA